MKKIKINEEYKKLIIEVGKNYKSYSDTRRQLRNGNVRVSSVNVLDKNLDKEIEKIKKLDGSVGGYDEGGIVIEKSSSVTTYTSSGSLRGDVHNFIENYNKYEKEKEVFEGNKKKLPQNIKIKNNGIIICNVDVEGSSDFLESFTNIEIKNSNFDNLTFSGKKYIKIKESSVENMSLNGTSSQNIIVDIQNTKITNLNNINDKFKNFSFDMKSKIINNSRVVYSELKNISNSDIQKHIFHVKETKSFVQGVKKWSDDWWLFNINNILNKNGLSFGIPLLWFIVINIYFVLFMFLYFWGELDLNFLLNFLNISPFHSLNISEKILQDNIWIHSIDNFRRALMLVFYYLIISSSIRFKFKK